jgi:hypothetical protein
LHHLPGWSEKYLENSVIVADILLDIEHGDLANTKWEFSLFSCNVHCNFLQPPVTSSLLGPNIFLSALFSKTINNFYVKNNRFMCNKFLKKEKEMYHVTLNCELICGKRICWSILALCRFFDSFNECSKTNSCHLADLGCLLFHS